ncbi:MAG TPA: methyltransferase domain-containing protein [Ardenticatenaceae bacterium]|nr:methyltransferase domain-containing protein [Ardenticatenaceae bacterium]
MTFEALLRGRNVADYAEFLIPHLAPGFFLLDVGCGGGSLSIGLAQHAGRVIGVDPNPGDFAGARQYALEQGMTNIEFRSGNVYALEFPDDQFDACFCHSVLEALDRPLDALQEIRRVLRPGGVVGLASVEYGGLILAGPHEPLLRRFYAIRERLWQIDAGADPYRGRALRGLLKQAGFEGIVASSKYIAHGTDEAVQGFGIGRAEDCRDEWYASAAQKHGLATEADLEAMRQAWMEWAEAPSAYAAFAWCRAVAWKPEDERL